MKITDIKVIPLTVQHEYLKGIHEGSLSYAIVKIQTSDGIIGYGEISDSFGCTYPGLMVEVVDQVLKRFLIDEDPLDTERLVNKMRSWTRRRLGDSWIVTQAISGVEIALLDILGKHRNQPICEILGAKRDRVDLYSSGTFLQEGSAKWFMELFQKSLDQGIQAVKVRIGSDYEKDLITLRDLRKEMDEGVKISIDGNENFTLMTAMKVAEKLKECGIYFFEEPLPVFNIEGMARLKKSSKVPIAYGEHTFNLSGFAELINRKATDVLQPDAAISGGIIECKKIGDLAHVYGLPVCPHSACSPIGLVANLHLSACIPTFDMLEYSPIMLQDLAKLFLIDEKVSLKHVSNGALEVPRGPGLGIEVAEDNFSKFPYIPLGIEKKSLVLSQGTI